MVSFEVNDMTCGHCVGVITGAVQSVDPGAKVQVDLASHRVQIDASASNANVFRDAIKVAGYTPVPLTGVAPMAVEAAPRMGCCCG